MFYHVCGIIVGRKGCKLGRNGEHWVICATWTYHFDRSMPRVSTERDEVTKRLMGGDFGRTAECGNWYGCRTWWSFEASSTIRSLWCCGMLTFLVWNFRYLHFFVERSLKHFHFILCFLLLNFGFLYFLLCYVNFVKCTFGEVLEETSGMFNLSV